MRRYNSLTFSLSCGSFWCTFSSRRCPYLFSFKLNSFNFFFLCNWQVVHYRLLVEPLIWNESLQQYIIQLIDFSNLPVLCSKYFHEHPKPYEKTHQSQQLSLPNSNTIEAILCTDFPHLHCWGGNWCLWIKYWKVKPKLIDGLLRWCSKAFGVMIIKPIQARNKGYIWLNSNKSPIKILHNT